MDHEINELLKFNRFRGWYGSLSISDLETLAFFLAFFIFIIYNVIDDIHVVKLSF